MDTGAMILARIEKRCDEADQRAVGGISLRIVKGGIQVRGNMHRRTVTWMQLATAQENPLIWEIDRVEKDDWNHHKSLS